MERCAIGVDIGGTHFRIGSVSPEGAVSDFRKLPVGQVFHSGKPLEELTTFLKAYCAGKEPEVIAIGFPATLDAERQTVLQAPNVPGMEHLPVVQALTEALGIPVFIERDVTMSLHYDCLALNLPKKGIVCGFYFGTGVGNAISVNGLPLVGRHGTAGELGHIPVDGNDLECGCGNRGCMETVAGGKYLAYLCRTAYPDTHISQLFVKHGDSPLLQQFVDRMAMAVATEVNILDPDYILIGGGVLAMADFPGELLTQRIYHHTRKPYPANDLNLRFVQDGEEKSVIGAAFYGWEQRQK